MRELEPFLHDGDQHVGADRDPDLRLHGVLAGAQKCLDAQVLLDPLEEQLDLPALPVQLGDQSGGQGKVVGQECDALAGFLVPHHDAAQDGRIVLARIEHRQHTGLIAQDVGAGAIHRVRVAPLELGIALGTGDEESLRLMNREQAPEVQIPAIEQVIRARFDDQGVQNIDLVGLAIGDVDEARDCTAQIQQGMQLDGGLGRTERCPRIDRQAQVDGGGIERIDRCIQIHRQGFLGVQRPSDADQVLRELGVHLPRPHRIRVRERVARNRLAAKTHVVQPRRLRSQVDFDIAQRLAPGQLGEGHGEELVEAGELLHLVIAAVHCHAAAKRGQGQMGHDLRKHEHALMHGSLRRMSAKAPKSAPRRSNRDQTKPLVSARQSSTYNRLS